MCINDRTTDTMETSLVPIRCPYSLTLKIRSHKRPVLW